jgi:hypothetical protein
MFPKPSRVIHLHCGHAPRAEVPSILELGSESERESAPIMAVYMSGASTDRVWHGEASKTKD